MHVHHPLSQTQFRFVMVKGMGSGTGSILCQAVNNYKISTIVLGRRGLGRVTRFFLGSTSRYVLENAECNVIIIKQPFGAPEEHDSKTAVIQAEESERLRREGESPSEIHESDLEEIKRSEEEERRRRMDVESMPRVLDKMFAIYKLRDEITTPE
eukprot:TRINITY_DN6368_c0_g1_i2.p1 TRINITY_DN6368_c0_g1~~TRINITY_DN6368_c0_g1_i2.p1  ORF type:complete len:155 (+),score=28.90 TRINITY_DN6368_c0_g1_i2:471-935(+)